MRVIRADAPTRLQRRICVACGYDGPEIDGDLGEVSFRCPGCGEDIYARPPMTYLEMEGFVPLIRADPPAILLGEPDLRRPHRWWAQVLAAVRFRFAALRRRSARVPRRRSITSER